MRKLGIGFVSSLAILWLGVFIFVHHKIDVIMEQYAPSKVLLADKRIYIKFGLKNPLTIVLKGSVTKSDNYLLDINLHLFPSFSGLIGDMYLSNEMISLPVSVTTKLSKSNNFYITDFAVSNARFKINNSDILLDGKVELYKDRLPSGGYKISISDTEKLLASDLLSQHPDILYKIKRILSKIGANYRDIKIDYTESGLQIDGIPLENI